MRAAAGQGVSSHSVMDDVGCPGDIARLNDTQIAPTISCLPGRCFIIGSPSPHRKVSPADNIPAKIRPTRRRPGVPETFMGGAIP